MKRVGFIYDKICDIDNILLAMNNAARGKKSHYLVRKILDNKGYYANELRNRLILENLELSNNPKKIIFEKHSRKYREITISKYYPDQVIHWALMQQLSPILFKSMYEYNCGSIPGRGGALAKKYIESRIINNRNDLWIAKLDIKKYFMNIDLDKLKSLFRLKIKDNRTLHLIDMIIDNGAPGLPIGYYTSQWFSNFYLEQLDHYIKENLLIKYYIRYVDDLVLVDYESNKLHLAINSIKYFLIDNKFNVKLKDDWSVFKWDTQPLDFVGYRFYRNKLGTKIHKYTLVRTHIYYNIYGKLRLIRNNKSCTVHDARSILSLEGWIKGSSSYKKYYLTRNSIITKSKLSCIISNNDRGVLING